MKVKVKTQVENPVPEPPGLTWNLNAKGDVVHRDSCRFGRQVWEWGNGKEAHDIVDYVSSDPDLRFCKSCAGDLQEKAS